MWPETETGQRGQVEWGTERETGLNSTGNSVFEDREKIAHMAQHWREDRKLGDRVGGPCKPGAGM